MTGATPQGRPALAWLHSLGAGIVFGAGLLVAGMFNPAKVHAFLDITGRWDPSLAFVMAGAIAIAAPAFLIARRLRDRGRSSWTGAPLPGNPPRRIDAQLVAGSLLFGVGWGLSGYCPGPAITSLGFGSAQALWFVVPMLLGVLLQALVRRR